MLRINFCLSFGSKSVFIVFFWVAGGFYYFPLLFLLSYDAAVFLSLKFFLNYNNIGY